MFTSKVEVSPCGKKYLICFYDPGRKNWSEVIEQAKLKHKLDESVAVLCLPKRKV